MCKCAVCVPTRALCGREPYVKAHLQSSFSPLMSPQPLPLPSIPLSVSSTDSLSVSSRLRRSLASLSHSLHPIPHSFPLALKSNLSFYTLSACLSVPHLLQSFPPLCYVAKRSRCSLQLLSPLYPLHTINIPPLPHPLPSSSCCLASLSYNVNALRQLHRWAFPPCSQTYFFSFSFFPFFLSSCS